MSKLTIHNLDLKNKRVFIRVDFNVPLAPGGQEITSDKRIKASLPTINYALEHGAAVILASHLGRPKGKPNPEMSLKPVAARLEQLLKRPVKMAPDCAGPEVRAMLPAAGEVLLLENLRFHAEEEKNEPEVAKQLAELGGKLMLPVDHVVVSEIAAGAAYEVVETIPEGKIAVDIGPKTIEAFAKVIAGAKTVVWNGPMGIFEKPPFDRGTVAIAKAVADSGATSIVGGGDSEKAIKAAGVASKITHISTGGGAS